MPEISLAAKRRIYLAARRSARKAEAVSLRDCPVDPCSPQYSDQAIAAARVQDTLERHYLNEIAKGWGISVDTVYKIFGEGAAEGWPDQ